MVDSVTQTAFKWFQGKRALITGASSGIGRAIALELGRLGTRIAVHYRGGEREAHLICEEIEKNGGSAIALCADLSRSDEVLSIFHRCDQELGQPLDMLVNNAGQWMDKSPIRDCPIELWDRMFNINARSVFLCCQQAVQRMAAKKAGAIVNIGSLAGHTGGGGGTVPYATAKAAVHTMTRGLAREVASLGIRVNAVAPGMVDTPMLAGRVSEQAANQLNSAIPLGTFAQPAEIVPAILFLLSPGASYITGEVIDVNGGLLMR
ncbi:MAG TPA: SDR family oxidoreductase [Tepidisphaeraceae bacterium]|nr:SDR family oxidoreductase [Tepidisphaeraceae bacterium]